MIQSQRALFLLLLLRAHVLQFFGQLRGIPFELLQLGRQRVGFTFPSFHLGSELAQLALQRQRAPARLAAAAHGMAVIADAIRKQEVIIRMFGSQSLGRGVLPDQETFRETRQIVSLAQAERIAQTTRDLRAD